MVSMIKPYKIWMHIVWNYNIHAPLAYHSKFVTKKGITLKSKAAKISQVQSKATNVLQSPGFYRVKLLKYYGYEQSYQSITGES